MHIIVRRVSDPDEKSAITRNVMHALPTWFSPPEDIEKKAVIHRDYPFFAAYASGDPIGFIALKIHNAHTAEINVIGVLESCHRNGAGRLLVCGAEGYCVEGGYRFLTVKTLDASAVYEPYNRTRAFYKEMGFFPLEVFPLHWIDENPCLFLAKSLG
jgi:GNAT superfamily N-acetyltransferase